MTCAAFYAYMLYGWFPSYLQEARHVGKVASSWLTGSVLIAGAFGVTLGGWLGDWLSERTGSRRQTLRWMGVIGLLAGARAWRPRSTATRPGWRPRCSPPPASA